MKRSVASAILLGVSLFILRAFATAKGDTLPFAAPIDALPKSIVSTHAPTSAFVPDLAFSFERPGDLFDHSATIDYSDFDATSRSITPTLPTAADLVIQPLQAIHLVPGGTTVYTLTIRNRGPAQATGIVLTNTLAKGVVPFSTQPAQPWCDRQDRSVRCALGDLRPSDATTVTLDLSVGGNQTHVTDTQLAGVTLDLSTPNCAIDASQSIITCRLAKLPAGTEAQVRVGARLDSQIAGAAANRAVVTANERDPNPANNQATFSMTAGPAATMTPTPVPAITDLAMQANGPSSVIAGQPFTYTYTVTNRGKADATGVHFEDALPPTANLYAYTPGLPACAQRGAVLACSFRDPDTAENIPFTLAITGNAGQAVRIAPDPLMPGWPVCTVLKERTWLHIVKCELGTLKRGQTTHVQLGLVAIGLLEGTMTNTAAVSAREADINPRDNTITATMTVRVRADLALRSALSGPAVAGKPLSYTLTVANKGPSDADGVVLTDTLPLGTRFFSAVPSQSDNCRLERKDAAPGTVVCRLGPLGGGRSATVTVVLAVDEPLTARGQVVHLAKVTSEQADPDLRNNQLVDSIPVRGGAKE